MDYNRARRRVSLSTLSTSSSNNSDGSKKENRHVHLNRQQRTPSSSPFAPSASFVKSLMRGGGGGGCGGKKGVRRSIQHQLQQRQQQSKTKTATAAKSPTSVLSPSSFFISTLGACTGISGIDEVISVPTDDDDDDDDDNNISLEYRCSNDNEHEHGERQRQRRIRNSNSNSNNKQGYDCTMEELDDLIVKLTGTTFPSPLLTSEDRCRTSDTLDTVTDSILILNSTDNTITEEYLTTPINHLSTSTSPSPSKKNKNKNRNKSCSTKNKKTTGTCATVNVPTLSPFLRCQWENESLSTDHVMAHDINTDAKMNRTMMTIPRCTTTAPTATTADNSLRQYCKHVSQAVAFPKTNNNKPKTLYAPAYDDESQHKENTDNTTSINTIVTENTPIMSNHNGVITAPFLSGSGGIDSSRNNNNHTKGNNNNRTTTTTATITTTTNTVGSNRCGTSVVSGSTGHHHLHHRDVQYWRQRLYHSTKYYGKTHTKTADAYFNLGQAQLKVQYSNNCGDSSSGTSSGFTTSFSLPSSSLSSSKSKKEIMHKKQQQQYDVSVENLTMAYQIWERKHGPHHVSVGRSCDALALAVVRRANHSNKSANKTKQQANNNNNNNNDSNNNAVQVVFEYDMRYAQRLLEQAFAIRAHSLGIWHVDTVESYNKLASVYLHLGHIREAVLAYREVFLVRRAIFGPTHPSVAISSHSVANCYYKLRHSTESLKWYQISLTIYEAMKLPYRHPTVAKLLKDRSRLEQYM